MIDVAELFDDVGRGLSSGEHALDLAHVKDGDLTVAVNVCRQLLLIAERTQLHLIAADHRRVEDGDLAVAVNVAEDLGYSRVRGACRDRHSGEYADDQDSKIVIPAEIDSATIDKIRTYAHDAFAAIDGAGPTRADFFVDRDTGDIYINEVNTMPGFTDISMYPMMWENMGVSYSELVERLIQTAKRKKVTDYTLK